jgi:hypothetical protein
MSLTDATTFRPRNGVSAESYWRVRYWCERHGFTLSDVLNALFVPIAYYLENHCTIDHSRNMATVELNAGFVNILHVFNGKCYPIASLTSRPSISLSDIQAKIDYWHEQNKSTPTTYDLLLLKDNANAEAKLKQKRLQGHKNRGS